MAVHQLFDSIFKTRLATEYHERLGGDWSRGAVQEYVQSVVYLRNRVVNAAYFPTFKEASDAVAALLKLEVWIGDRLASDTVRNTYPRTAITWSGRKGLERREKYTKRMQQVARDTREPNWTKAFAMWRFHFFSARGAYPPPPTGNAEIVVDVGDGPRRFVVVDVTALFAAVVDDPRPFLDQAQFEYIDQLEERLRANSGGRKAFALKVVHVVDWTAHRLVWVPAYQILDSCRYDLPNSDSWSR